jgi:predicted XRE-type DNA-binding protein
MIDIEEGCQNIYADLDSVGAEAMHRKAQLVSQITGIIQADGISLAKAAEMTSLNLEALLKGQFRQVNEAELAAYWRLLDREAGAGR